eukprot:GFUD01031988.1.p1 GENE.GFUD01031988.1~~GFUD01031988.1.p1  ORF type:complete len:997 (+),score=213.69 GFUD01031988.1:96-3086(+)
MGRGMVSGFILVTLASETLGYNLNENNFGTLEGNGNADSLFGWSLQHFKGDLFVGAPGDDKKGAVYQCTNIDTSPDCKKMETPSGLYSKNWYGGSLAASDSDLYTCSFRSGYKAFMPFRDKKKPYSPNIGKCFKTNGNIFEDLINFRDKSTIGGNTWRSNGINGLSATVSDKTGELIVGSPRTFDKKGGGRHPYIATGSIWLISDKDTMKMPTDKAPWVTTESDISTMSNVYKNAGYSLETGRFFTGKSTIVGAPKANNYRGSVYVCHDCFGETFDETKNMEVNGLQMGESFGAATAACDITGDGKDDLIVGAPTYSPNRMMFNSGRIHIFNFENGIELRRVSPETESRIEPPGDQEEQMGARFGSAVACLGDTDGDGSEEVVVGAPFFDNIGAIFIYRAKKSTQGLLLSQIIKSQGMSGFGMKLSTSKLKDTSARGFAVGAPAGQNSVYIKVRNVPRFTDITHVKVNPKSVTSNETKLVVVTVTPTIQRKTKFTDKLTITAKITTDNRLVETNQIQKTEIKGDENFGNSLEFTFNPEQPDFGLAVHGLQSLVFKISLEYKLDSCSDSYRHPCPIFDPEDTTGGQKTEQKDKKTITKTLPDQIIDFNICEDTRNCMCDIKASIDKANKIVAGKTSDIYLGDIHIENIGTEPSFSTILEITIDKNNYIFLPQKNCFSENCSFPFINAENKRNSKYSIPLKLKPIGLIQTDIKFVEIQVKLTSTCKDKNSAIAQEKFEIPVKHEWKIKTEQKRGQESQNYIWDQKIEQEEIEESKHIALRYNVYNEGPSMSKESKLFAFIPVDSKLIENINVTYANTDCKQRDRRDDQIQPPQATSNLETDTKLLVCQAGGLCDIFECDLHKGMKKEERTTLQVQFDFLKKNAKLMGNVLKFKIVTSICTMSHNEDEFCVNQGQIVLQTTTSFEYIRKTTLDSLIESWQWLVGGVSALVVFLIVFAIFYKFDIFKKVRFYDELMEKDIAKKQKPSEVEIDGETVELRT